MIKGGKFHMVQPNVLCYHTESSYECAIACFQGNGSTSSFMEEI